MWTQPAVKAVAPAAPRPARAVAAAPPLRRVTVQRGDSLWSIAVASYGDGSRWRSLWTANRAQIGADPRDLAVGMRLVLPAR